MSIFEAMSPSKPTAEQGAMRVRRTLAMVFGQAEAALGQVRHIMERHGAKEIKSALGKDAKEVEKLYRALKDLVETHKPDTTVEDLPS